MSAFLAGFAAAFNLASAPCSAPEVPDTYDSDFRAAAGAYWSPSRRMDWCELKRRAMVESSFRESVVSPAGAVGLLQVMPETAGDFGVPVSDLYRAKHNIQVAARVSERNWNFWITDRPHEKREDLERACYNAGCGHILEAQKRCGMARDWEQIKECLPQVTGRHAKETIEYVERHKEWRERLNGRSIH